MSDSLPDVIRRIVAGGPSVIKQVRRQVRRIIDGHDLAARLFLDDNGEVKPAAREWFARLAAENYVNGGAFNADPREHAFREGRRDLALEIITSARLDVERLEALTRLEREIE